MSQGRRAQSISLLLSQRSLFLDITEGGTWGTLFPSGVQRTGVEEGELASHQRQAAEGRASGVSGLTRISRGSRRASATLGQSGSCPCCSFPSCQGAPHGGRSVHVSAEHSARHTVSTSGTVEPALKTHPASGEDWSGCTGRVTDSQTRDWRVTSAGTKNHF